MITAHHLVFGRTYQGLFKIPFGICNRYRFYISTRSGNLVIKMPDGEIINYNTPKLSDLTLVNNTTKVERNYATPFPAQDVDVVTNNGNNDVYSFLFDWANAQYNDNYNIQNIADFWAQFPNLYSIHYNIYAYFNVNAQPTIKGNIMNVGKTVQRVRVQILDVINRFTNAYVDLNELPIGMNLQWWSDEMNSVSINYRGDLAKLPPNIYYFKCQYLNTNSNFSYTSGRIWASSFDTLDIGSATISDIDVDNILIDMANSITTAIGGKLIRIIGGLRTSASNTAVTYLQSLGFTVNINARAKILDLPLQNNFTDTTGINTIISGGTSNFPTFTLEGTEYGATFNGSQSLKTNANLNINYDKVSVSFWIKTSQTQQAVLIELSNNSDTTNAFYVALNNAIVNHLSLRDRIGSNISFVASPYNIGDWNHVVCIIDRRLPIVNECSIYVNKILSSTIVLTTGEINENFGLFPLFIGQRAGSTLGFNGQLKFLKIFNYPLSTTEITNLYNKTM